ncbi:unnamed protein product [Urochloa decumbens]|uniref:KIB1-4 beta-propeller domain-containing protein n=1 Tax=Urochloa decumbens TaxID=240449 RepID=A0ABC9E9P7_9POAL
MKRRGSDGWSTLPCDLLGEICSHLSTDADHLHVHQVCAHWRAWTSPLAAFRPWIVARVSRSPAPGDDDPDHSAWFPRRLHPRKVETGRRPPAGLPYCRGASRGWLALADDAQSPTRLVLWDPASGAEVPLPCLSSVCQVFLSGDPLGPADWMAVASQGGRITKSFFWRPGDTAWSSLYERPTAGVFSVAFHGGRVFYMDLRPLLAVYDLNLGAPRRPPASAGMSASLGREVERLCRCDRFVHPAHESVLVSCNGELLLVVLRSGATCQRGGRPPPPSSRVSPPCSSFADVYKLDWTPERGLEVGDRVMDLGDHSLFLGLSESFALSAKECPAIRRNHIYCLARNWHDCFRPRNRKHKLLEDWAFVFDLGSGTLKGIPCPEELRDEEPNWWACSWLYLRSPLLKKQQQ